MMSFEEIPTGYNQLKVLKIERRKYREISKIEVKYYNSWVVDMRGDITTGEDEVSCNRNVIITNATRMIIAHHARDPHPHNT